MYRLILHTPYLQRVVIVVHLTNAFLLALLVTYMISFADSGQDGSPAHANHRGLAATLGSVTLMNGRRLVVDS
jgi:hypothetical protein